MICVGMGVRFWFRFGSGYFGFRFFGIVVLEILEPFDYLQNSVRLSFFGSRDLETVQLFTKIQFLGSRFKYCFYLFRFIQTSLRSKTSN